LPNHPKIIAVGEMIDDLPVSELVPMNMLNLEALASRLCADQEPAHEVFRSDSPMRAADAATDND
jgi:hypothetical protein